MHFAFIKYLKCINFHVFSVTESKMLGSMNRTKNNFDYLSIHTRNLLNLGQPFRYVKKDVTFASFLCSSHLFSHLNFCSPWLSCWPNNILLNDFWISISPHSFTFLNVNGESFRKVGKSWWVQKELFCFVFSITATISQACLNFWKRQWL